MVFCIHSIAVKAIPQNWQPVCRKFTAIWIADGSTLEALRRKLKALKEQEKILAGKIMMVVEAFNHRPVTTWYTTNSKANDKSWCDQLLERLPVGGLLIFDAVLNQLCIDVAFAKRVRSTLALNQALDRISTEMVFRGLYHFSQAVLRGDASEAVPYLVEHQKLFGLVKTRRKRHREIDAYTQQIWALSS